MYKKNHSFSNSELQFAPLLYVSEFFFIKKKLTTKTLGWALKNKNEYHISLVPKIKHSKKL